jgi:hypothetical protein
VYAFQRVSTGTPVPTYEYLRGLRFPDLPVRDLVDVVGERGVCTRNHPSL